MDIKTSALCVLLLCAISSSSAARLLNITKLENCQNEGLDAVVKLTTVSYHVDEATGVSDTVHGEFSVDGVEHKPRILTITLYKCPDPKSTEACFSNPSVHEETIGCDRLIGDDSGPWAMFSEALARSNCGKEKGSFNLDYSTLKLNNLMNYLDIHDEEFGRYRLRMSFLSTTTNSIRACLDLDFKLVN